MKEISSQTMYLHNLKSLASGQAPSDYSDYIIANCYVLGLRLGLGLGLDTVRTITIVYNLI